MNCAQRILRSSRPIWLTVVLAACGGGGSESPAPTSTQASTPEASTPSGTMQATSTPGAAASGAGRSAPASSAAGGSAPAVTTGAMMSSSASTAGASGTQASSGSAQAGTPAAAAGASAAGSGAQPAAAGAAGASDSTMMTVDSSEPMPSMGCSGGSLSAGRTMGRIMSAGGNRSYTQYLPRGYDGSKPVPLVVDLHPFSQGAAFQESSSGFRSLADMENYAYLAPQGIGNEWDATGDMDEKFIRDLVNKVAAEGCIDLRRVYATGCSNGGAFSFLLMCRADDVFAAVAPMCGTSFVNLETDCMMDRPVSMLLRLGRSDTLNCWEGEGMVLDAPNVPAGTRVPCAKTVQKILMDKYHCKGEIQKMDVCELVGDCDEGAEIQICYQNTGHVVYQSSTARDTYAFLKRHYKP